MLDEFKSAEYLINELNNQVGYFNENKDSAISLLQNVSKVKSKYEMPYLLYLTRNIEGVYNKEKSSLLENIAYTLNLHIKEKAGLEYSVNFLDVKRMIFTISKDDIELVRFSLVNKNYAFMGSVIQDEKEYLEGVDNVERNIQKLNEDIVSSLDKIALHKKSYGNYFKLIKHVKTIGDLYNLIFKYKKIKQNLSNVENNINYSIDATKTIIESENERKRHLKDKYERSKPIVDKLSKYFDDIDYKMDERYKFYN